MSTTTHGPENIKNGKEGKEDQKVHDKIQGTKERHEVRKKLFGEKEGEKMDVPKVIQAAMIDDEEDRESDKMMWENPLYQEDNKEIEGEGIAKAWNEVDRKLIKKRGRERKKPLRNQSLLEKGQLRKMQS